MGIFAEERDYTEAQLKGRRVRMVRILSGLTRQELYKRIHLSPSTINTWETGRVELSEIAAGRVCDAFSKIGILCTTEWLLTGQGAPPRMMNSVEKVIFNADGYDSQQKKSAQLDNIPEDIQRELAFFTGIHSHSLFHIVKENFMNSRYKVGDCVGGIISPPQSLIGCTVIIEEENGDTILGKLTKYVNDTCEISTGNKFLSIKVKARAVAEVVWHRMISRKH